MQISWIHWLPGLLTLRDYRAAWLAHDIVAGIVLATMLVPVGIAYAVASGVPGIYGLYATIVPLLAYALFGPSRILVLGPDSSLAAVILGVVAPLSGGDPRRAVALAGMMAIVSGLVCILAGVARLGFVTDLLSKPIRYGYMNGIALTVLISQVPKLLGFSIENEGPLRDVWDIATAIILEGRTNWTAFAIGAGTLAVILLLKNSERVPGILISMVGATAISGFFDLEAHADLSVLGPMPQGLPAFVIPWITSADVVPIMIGGCAVAVASFADTSVLSRAYAARLGAKVDPNQEMVGLGAANSRRRLLPGFPNQQQFIAHSRGGGRRRPDAIDWSCRRTRRRPSGSDGAEPAPTLAERRAGGGGDYLCHRIARNLRPASNSTASSAGNSGCPSSAWSGSRSSARSRASASRSPSPSSSSSGTAGARTPRYSVAPKVSAAITTSRAILMRGRYPALFFFAGMPPCSSPTPNCSSSAS